MANGEGVTYTVKELLGKLEDALTAGFKDINDQLKDIKQVLDDKVSNARFRELEEAYERYRERTDARLESLEGTRRENIAISKFKLILAGFVVTIAAAGVSSLLYMLVQGVHSA